MIENSGAWPNNAKEKYAKVSYVWVVISQVYAFVDKPRKVWQNGSQDARKLIQELILRSRLVNLC